MPQPGDTVHHYRLQRLIGSGAEGHVFLAVDTRDGVLRTLKLLKGRNRYEDARHTARYFQRLASCPSVKPFYEWGVLDGQRSVGQRPWLVFQYIEGHTLAQHILAGRIKNPRQILLAVCEALVPIHRKGMAIGDFDNDRNLIIERSTKAIRFCDLDAGTPVFPPGTQDEDLEELLRLARRLDRCCGHALGRRLLDSLSKADSVSEWQRLLEAPV